MIVANYIALILVLIGALNWGLVGLLNFNLVAFCCFGVRLIERIIYVIVLLAAIYLIVACAIWGGILLVPAAAV